MIGVIEIKIKNKKVFWVATIILYARMKYKLNIIKFLIHIIKKKFFDNKDKKKIKKGIAGVFCKKKIILLCLV